MGEGPKSSPQGRTGADSVATRRESSASGIAAFILTVAAAGLFLRIMAARAQPVATWLVWDLLELWTYVLLFWAGTTSLGVAVLKRLIRFDAESSSELLIVAVPIGVLGFNVLMYVGGALAIYRPWFGVGLPLAMLAAGGRDLGGALRTFTPRLRPAPASTWSTAATWIATGFGVLAAGLLYLQILTPDAITFDAAWSHLPIAQDYARSGRMIGFDADFTRCLPHLASIVHTYAFLVPLKPVQLRWMLALHNEFVAVLLTALGVGVLIERLVGARVRAGWAAFFLFPGIFVYDLRPGGGADHYEALFAAPLALATIHAIGTTEKRRYALVGLLAGGALATKLQALYLILPVGGMLVAGLASLVSRERPWNVVAEGGWRRMVRRVSAALGAFLGATVLALVPHLVRNAAFHHNPVYPLALSLFPGSYPSVPDAGFLFEYLFKDWNWRPHGGALHNLGEALGLVITHSFVPHYSFTHGVPNLGSLFCLTLPLLLVIRDKRRILIVAGLAAGATVLWALIFRVDRHLQPLVPLFAAATGAILVRSAALGNLARFGVVALVSAQLAFSGDVISYSGRDQLVSSLDLIRSTYDGQAARRYDRFRRDFLDVDAALPPGATVLLHDRRTSLGIDKRVYLDWAGQQALIDYRPVRTPRDLYDLYQRLGITHLLREANVRPAPSKQEDALVSAFAANRAGGQHIGPFELVPTSGTPPPLEAPWRALSLGLGGYADGLYSIEAMGTFDALPIAVRSYAPPSMSVDHDPAALAQALATVQVVFLGKEWKALAATLTDHFVAVASYPDAFVIYVRK